MTLDKFEEHLSSVLLNFHYWGRCWPFTTFCNFTIRTIDNQESIQQKRFLCGCFRLLSPNGSHCCSMLWCCYFTMSIGRKLEDLYIYAEMMLKSFTSNYISRNYFRRFFLWQLRDCQYYFCFVYKLKTGRRLRWCYFLGWDTLVVHYQVLLSVYHGQLCGLKLRLWYVLRCVFISICSWFVVIS